MKQPIFTCRHCGNLIAMLHDAGIPVYCCGEEMQQIIPGATDASQEKHAPVYRVEGNTVFVSVGSQTHPMTPEHHIQWICLETDKGVQYAQLSPQDKPEATFVLGNADSVRAVYAFCNQHDLWSTT